MVSGRIAEGLRTMRIIWLCLLVSHGLFLLMIVSHLAHSRGSEVMPPHLPEMLGVVAVAIAVGSFVLPARALDVALRGIDVRVTNEVGEAIGSFRESAPVAKVVADPKKAVGDALLPFHKSFVTGLAMAESISLFGMLIGYYGQPTYTFAPFFALGIAIALVKFPRLSTLTSAIERVKGARCDLKL